MQRIRRRQGYGGQEAAKMRKTASEPGQGSQSDGPLCDLHSPLCLSVSPYFKEQGA
jgi:hypothetical protein